SRSAYALAFPTQIEAYPLVGANGRSPRLPMKPITLIVYR
ncbi:MAG: hypothetical protein RLZZ535_3772, partial [Cyanobacteriota bacterium]